MHSLPVVILNCIVVDSALRCRSPFVCGNFRFSVLLVSLSLSEIVVVYLWNALRTIVVGTEEGLLLFGCEQFSLVVVHIIFECHVRV